MEFEKVRILAVWIGVFDQRVIFFSTAQCANCSTDNVATLH